MDEETRDRWRDAIDDMDSPLPYEEDVAEESDVDGVKGTVVESETLYGCAEDEEDGTEVIHLQLVDYGEDCPEGEWRYLVRILDSEEDEMTWEGFDDLDDAKEHFEREKKDFFRQSDRNFLDIKEAHADSLAELSCDWNPNGVDAKLVNLIAMVVMCNQSEAALDFLKEHGFGRVVNK